MYSLFSKRINATFLAYFLLPCFLHNYLYAYNSIRNDHPRLFFNVNTLSVIRYRAINQENEYYSYIKSKVDSLLVVQQQGELETTDYGLESAWAAFVYLVDGNNSYLQLAQNCIEISLDYYEQCFDEKIAVNWRAHTRTHIIMAIDWLYNYLPQTQRNHYITRTVQYVDNMVNTDHHISGEHPSSYTEGMYGYRSLLWYAGLLAYGTGIETQKIENWLAESEYEHFMMLDYRASLSDDDGGGSASTIDYVAGWYPYAEWNFYYTMLSSTGTNIIENLEYNKLLPNYIFWNLLPSSDVYRSFGYGDLTHAGGNKLWANEFLYTNLSIIEDLFGQTYPETDILSVFIKRGLTEYWQKWRDDYFIYPFLLENYEKDLQSDFSVNMDGLPKARYFEQQGQVFMCSGFEKSDVYCMFSCSEEALNHTHYDALHFTIYTDNSFLAVDSGDRYLAEEEDDSMAHLLNYYSQSVAHNTILINQPGEPTTRYWNRDSSVMDGGQHCYAGSIKAFRQSEDYVYVAADATDSYIHNGTLAEKAELVTRQMVYLPPRHFIIYDRVISTQEDYVKRWLLHTIGQPQINTKTFYADHNDNRLFCKNLLPVNAEIIKIGGEGYEFWTAEQNWPLAKGALDEEAFDAAGRWRVEITPCGQREADSFLNILEISKTDKSEMTIVNLVELGNYQGVALIIDNDIWTVYFNKTGELNGSIVCENKNIDENFGLEIESQSGINGIALCSGEYGFEFDVDKNCKVDFSDYLAFVDSWLSCGLYPVSACH